MLLKFACENMTCAFLNEDRNYSKMKLNSISIANKRPPFLITFSNVIKNVTFGLHKYTMVLVNITYINV